jgi:hypothetical protein
METLKLVYIEWVDTVADPENGWKDEENTHDFFDREDNLVRETGFVFKEDEEYVCLVSRHMPTDEPNSFSLTGGRTKIPKLWIKKRVELSQYINE